MVYIRQNLNAPDNANVYLLFRWMLISIFLFILWPLYTGLNFYYNYLFSRYYWTTRNIHVHRGTQQKETFARFLFFFFGAKKKKMRKALQNHFRYFKITCINFLFMYRKPSPSFFGQTRSVIPVTTCKPHLHLSVSTFQSPKWR